MGRHNAANFSEPVQSSSVQTDAGSAVANTPDAETDDTDERLRRMMEELKS